MNTFDDIKVTASTLEDNYYILEYIGKNNVDPTLKPQEVEELKLKLAENKNITVNSSEVKIGYSGKVYNLEIEDNLNQRVAQLQKSTDENYPNIPNLNLGDNLFLMKYNALWLKYYPIFERRIETIVKSKPLVAKNHDSQERLLDISKDFATLFIFIMLYQGNKPGTNAQNENAPAYLKADLPEARLGYSPASDDGTPNDEHFLYYNKAARNTGALGFENNIMFTSQNDSWELIEQMKDIMRSIVSLILLYLPPTPYKTKNDRTPIKTRVLQKTQQLEKNQYVFHKKLQNCCN